jgi:N-acyl-D-amino-acid deacylase
MTYVPPLLAALLALLPLISFPQDPGSVNDRATYASPHRYSTGVVDVFVNGVQVLKDGEHTGAMPGRVVRGPGWKSRR